MYQSSPTKLETWSYIYKVDIALSGGTDKRAIGQKRVYKTYKTNDSSKNDAKIPTLYESLSLPFIFPTSKVSGTLS